MLIEKAGASAITVHGRTKTQMYSGKADWKYIKMVKDAVKIPVIGNGDIVCAADAKRMLDETGCDAVAIARGTLGNPFIFRELNEFFDNKNKTIKTNEEIYDTIIKHYNYLLELKGNHLAMLEMRSHVSWYIKGMTGSAKIKDLCNKQKDFNEVLKILKDFLLG